jgi:hypothetical protein
MSHKIFHRFISGFLVLAIAFAGFTPALAAPPANDDFNSATSIGTLPFTTSQDTSEATAAGDDPIECHNSGSVWYSFTPAANMLIVADTVGSDYDTTMAVYTGPQGGLTLVPGACNDDFYGLQSQVEFNAIGGTTYYFLLGRCCGTGGSGGGNLVFSVQEEAPPPNDNFINPQSISSLPSSSTVEARFATTEPDEPSACYGAQRTVWYTFTPAVSTAVQVDMQGSTVDSTVNIFHASGTGFSDLNFINCTGSFRDPFTFLAEAGEIYYFQANPLSGAIGTAQLNLNEIPAPPNNNFLDATVIPSSLPFDDFVNAVAATVEGNEPTSSCDNQIRTVWYAFTPTTSGPISASSNYGSVTAVYTGNSLASLTEIGCRPYYYFQPLTILADAGTTYYFQVGDLYGNGERLLQFHLEVTPPPVTNFYFYPSDPSIFDNLSFCDQSDDPGGLGFQTSEWDFGDGSTATGYCTNHHYAADGDYTVQHSVMTVDGRTASISQVVQVRTHDVSITKLLAPKTANVGQKRAITISIKNIRYPETVTIELYRSVDGGNFEQVGTLTKLVPLQKGNKTTQFSFNYTFSAQDAQAGKVIFRAIVYIEGARDSFPVDNVAVAIPPTVVK